MKKFLEPGNNNSLMSLLMLSEDGNRGLCYCENQVFEIETRGRCGTLLSKYNYIFGNLRRLHNYLVQFKSQKSLKGNFKIDSLYYDDKGGCFSAEVKYVSKHDEHFSFDGNGQIELVSGTPTILNLKKFMVAGISTASGAAEMKTPT